MELREQEKLENGEPIVWVDRFLADTERIPSHWCVFPVYLPKHEWIQIYLHESTGTYWATNPWGAHKDWVKITQDFDANAEEFLYKFPLIKNVFRCLSTETPTGRTVHRSDIVYQRTSKGTYTTLKDRNDQARTRISKTEMVRKIKALRDQHPSEQFLRVTFTP